MILPRCKPTLQWFPQRLRATDLEKEQHHRSFDHQLAIQEAQLACCCCGLLLQRRRGLLVAGSSVLSQPCMKPLRIPVRHLYGSLTNLALRIALRQPGRGHSRRGQRCASHGARVVTSPSNTQRRQRSRLRDLHVPCLRIGNVPAHIPIGLKRHIRLSPGVVALAARALLQRSPSIPVRSRSQKRPSKLDLLQRPFLPAVLPSIFPIRHVRRLLLPFHPFSALPPLSAVAPPVRESSMPGEGRVTATRAGHPDCH